MPKVSLFITSMILVSLLAVVFSNFMANMGTQYGVADSEANLSVYNHLNELADLGEEVKGETEGIDQQTGILDKIGAFFGDAFTALRRTGKSVTLFSEMTDDAVKEAHLGETAWAFKTTIITIVLITIFVGVFLKAVTKTDV